MCLSKLRGDEMQRRCDKCNEVFNWDDDTITLNCSGECFHRSCAKTFTDIYEVTTKANKLIWFKSVYGISYYRAKTAEDARKKKEKYLLDEKVISIEPFGSQQLELF